jgi:CBS domain-containing protein
MITASDLIDRSFPTISPDETMSRALPRLEDSNELLIIDGKDYQGFLVRKDVMKAKLSVEAKTSSFLRHVARLRPDEPVQEIARLMLESGVYQLPVLKGDELIGVVGADVILKKASKSQFGKEPIERYMTSDITTIEPGDNVGKAIKLFREEDISRLPVMEDGKLAGLLTMDDIIGKVIHPEDRAKGVGEYGEFIAEKKHYLKIPVKGIMTKTPHMMPPDTDVKDIIDKILKFDITGILIGTDKNLQGMVTKKDLLEPIAIQKREEKMVIQFAGDLDIIEGFDKEEGRSYLINAIGKHEDFLKKGYLYVHLKRHKETRHGSSSIYCKIRLSSPRGMFIASEEGWGFTYALKNAASTLERQVRRAKGR